jgi:phosphoglycerate dehydrogenase-like enzyme
MIGRRTISLLRPFDFEVVVYDPYLTGEDAAALGVESVTLEHLLSSSDIVSLHAPSLPETRHMLGRREIALLKPGATLVNTARGALVDHVALAERVLQGDVHAVLDHTDPEVLPAGHPFYDADNVFLTPHLAGSLGLELSRLADAAIAEARRFARGEPLRHPVRSSDLAKIA